MTQISSTVFIGADHGGFRLKGELVEYLKTFTNYRTEDLGTFTSESVDYPLIAEDLSHHVLSTEDAVGVLVCGTGIGVSIAANKIRGIRCALVHDSFTAKMARVHNNANVIAFGERVIGSGVAKEALSVFLSSQFESGGRHSERVSLITKIENK